MFPLSALESSMITSLEARKRLDVPRYDADIVAPDHGGDFFSNDYLSIGKIPRIRRSFVDALSRTPFLFGSTGSRAISGSTSHHVELEEYFVEQFEAEKAMIFNSGYMCNLTFFGYAPQEGDVILYDEFIHASIHDGFRISRAKDHTFAFSHNSVPDFESKLKQILHDYPAIPSGLSTLFIVIESVYSMEGDFSPMEEIITLVEKYVPSKSAHIVVDEAHSLGLYGPAGKGLLREWGLEKRVHSVIFPFTKAVNFIGCK
jgi:8-amino-7-oxononanoate synthase